MKINKLFFGLLAVAGLLFTACHENDDDDYKWATASGEQVYFDFSLPSRVDLDKDANSFTIPLKRLNTSSAITVPLTATITAPPAAEGEEPANPVLTFPTSASFNAGEAETNITVTYDPKTYEYDEYLTVDLTVDNAQATNYGKNIYKFTIGVPSPLEYLGECTFKEGFWFEDEWTCELYQNTENPNEFRMKDPFGVWKESLDGNQSEWLVFTVLKPGDAYGDIEITQNDLVFFSGSDGYLNTGYYHSSYSADVLMLHPFLFSSSTEETAIHNRVLSYQENGLPGQVQLAPYYYMLGIGGWNQMSADGLVVITFPDYVPLDMEATALYQGIFTDTESNVFAVANLKLGKDATDVRAVVVPADADADAVADAVASGDLESTEVTAGRIEVPVGEDMTGKLQIVIVMLYEGKVMNIVTVPFEYYGGGKNPWQSLGNGLYTEGFFSSMFNGVESVTYEVEIQENTETPGLYRMVYPYDGKYPYNEAGDWDTSTSYDIEINCEDPDGVYIPLQPTGVDWTYGPISICSWGGYALNSLSFQEAKEKGLFGKLENGVITLPTFSRAASDGSTLYYQGLLAMGESGYYAGNGFKLVLPSAVTNAAKAKAKSAAKGYQFMKRLKGNPQKVSKREMRRFLPITKMELR